MKEMLKKESGITLIALVVTIVILVILATISVNLVINGGLINKTQNAANLDDLAREKERLELVKGQVAADVENLGKVTVDNYIEELIKEGITVADEVTDNGDGSKTVITDTGYSVTIVPKGDRDVEIIIDGKAGALPPRIAKIETTTTTSSFTAKAQVLRVNGGTVKYYYKLATESDEQYQEITTVTEEKGAEVTGLVAGTSYDVKVVAENANGAVEQTTEVTVTRIMVESISLKAEETVVVTKIVTLTATITPTNATNKNVTWTSSKPEIAIVNDAGAVTGIKQGETTITVTTTDGSNKTATCKIIVLPPPTAGTILETKPEGWTSSKVTPIADGEGGVLPLPNGYNYVGGDINTGIVISDKVGDTMNASGTSMGSQFVWIPMASESDFPTNSNEPYVIGYEGETTDYNTMKTQVLKYGGFFIGRFEAGVNSITLRTATTTAQAVVSKRGVAPYNYVPWGKSMKNITLDVTSSDSDSITTSTKGAVYLAKNMYTHPDSVISTLCYGCQWDVMCRYIGDSNRITPTKSKPELTGNVSTDVSKNIYDLAGNCVEWTMEARDGNARKSRGGYYHTAMPISNAITTNPPSASIANCFRLELYIK